MITLYGSRTSSATNKVRIALRLKDIGYQYYDEPQCHQVCPVECIPLLPELAESKEKLWEKYALITGSVVS